MSEETALTNPSEQDQGKSNPAIPLAPVEQLLSPQDKVNLYEVLQTLSQALRRIRHEDSQATKQQQQ